MRAAGLASSPRCGRRPPCSVACGQTGKLAAKRLSGYFGRPTDLSSACFPGGFAFALSLPSFHSCHHRLLAQACVHAWLPSRVGVCCSRCFRSVRARIKLRSRLALAAGSRGGTNRTAPRMVIDSSVLFSLRLLYSLAGHLFNEQASTLSTWRAKEKRSSPGSLASDQHGLNESVFAVQMGDTLTR